MFAFFDSISNFLSIAADVFISTIQHIVFMLEFISRAVVYLVGTTAFLPLFVGVPLLCGLSFMVILFMMGR